MKKINLETSKGKFIVVDIESDKDIYDIQSKFGYLLKDFCDWTYLKDITEQQASDIVEYKYNQSNYGQYNPTAIHRLHSLITSNGYYLFDNPYTDAQKYSESKYFEAQDKIFYNPIIFKLV